MLDMLEPVGEAGDTGPKAESCDRLIILPISIQQEVFSTKDTDPELTDYNGSN